MMLAGLLSVLLCAAVVAADGDHHHHHHHDGSPTYRFAEIADGHSIAFSEHGSGSEQLWIDDHAVKPGDPCRCPKGWETYSLCDAYGICVGNDQSSRLAKMCPPPSKTEPAVAQRGSGQTNDLFGELGNLLAAVRQQAVDMLSQDQCLRAKRAALEKDMVSGEYDRTFTCVCVPQTEGASQPAMAPSEPAKAKPVTAPATTAQQTVPLTKLRPADAHKADAYMAPTVAA